MKKTKIFLLLLIFLLGGCRIKPADSSKKLAPPKDDTVRITVSAVGDCTLGTDINYAGSHSFVSVYDELGDDSYFFKNVKHIFEEDDLTVINFEGALSENGERKDKEYAFRGKPEYAKILTKGFVDAASLSNNHSLDYGDVAFSDTKKILEDNGILWFEGKNFAIKNVKGINIGLIGTSFLRGGEKESFLENLEKLKAKNPDIIIASFHWGIEKEEFPDDSQQKYARLAIDNGADLVIGHHPHILQGIEKYNGKYIVYSLGNFCFGGSRNPSDKDTMIFQQTFSFKDGVLLNEDDAAIIPCSVSSIKEHNTFQPTPLSGDDFDRVANKIIERSASFSGIEEIGFIQK